MSGQPPQRSNINLSVTSVKVKRDSFLFQTDSFSISSTDRALLKKNGFSARFRTISFKRTVGEGDTTTNLMGDFKTAIGILHKNGLLPRQVILRNQKTSNILSALERAGEITESGPLQGKWIYHRGPVTQENYQSCGGDKNNIGKQTFSIKTISSP